MAERSERMTVPGLAGRKGGDKIVMITAYDAPTARRIDAAGADAILVGDSLGMVVLGHPTTLEVTMDEMIHHTRAAARGRERALLVGDMPWLSYHLGAEEAVRNAARFIRAGADAVKIEGGENRVGIVEALRAAEVAVMGHVGLTPQSYHAMGGFKVQGRDAEGARRVLADARALDRAGVFAIVLEGIPAPLAAEITAAVSVPTIGIGAGPDCDGQVLVFHDLMGLSAGPAPRFVRRYADLGGAIEEAARRFAADVRSGAFPGPAESYAAGPRAS